jgi:hypothetical protein
MIDWLVEEFRGEPEWDEGLPIEGLAHSPRYLAPQN